jgi:hypothetical protein
MFKAPLIIGSVAFIDRGALAGGSPAIACAIAEELLGVHSVALNLAELFLFRRVRELPILQVWIQRSQT